MNLDRFLARPPAPVQEDGFSWRVMLRLRSRLVFRRNLALASALVVMLALLAMLPVEIPLAELPLHLAIILSSPTIPWVGAGVAILLFAFQPRLRRF